MKTLLWHNIAPAVVALDASDASIVLTVTAALVVIVVLVALDATVDVGIAADKIEPISHSIKKTPYTTVLEV